MTDAAALLSAFDAQARPAEWEFPEGDATVDRDGPLFRVSWPNRRGFVAGPPDLGVEGDALDELIARQRDFFTARRQSAEWKTWSHDRPADLPDRLVAAGFTPEDTETVVIGLAEDMVAPVPLDGIVLRETRHWADIQRLVAASSEAFGKDVSFLIDYLIAKKDDPDTVIVVAEAEGRIVSSARLEIVPETDFCGLWGGSTLREWRGRGIYRALVAHRARVALARGRKYLQVDASEDSRPILERLGFVPVTTTTGFVWRPR
ncbi:Acetyltransferase (GNAT) family protein [Lentzea xinjiangensis]|uniref:Acetyltransferase (GNAT) family protein n=1 Tax=Lentzea xinjiangensis TaxID=402600 RepID=A0A1H9DVH2_9PSEU|nr:GNAT family N-acetyltransferase [Lentzea xinjiangensis]SEQ16758.1 Acetyltransferase (GNAT) family protein [Lentzea xinjiangensis]